MRAMARSPARSASPTSVTVAGACAVPTCSMVRVRLASGEAPRASKSSAVTEDVGACQPALASTAPRASAPSPSPRAFTARRTGARASGTSLPWTWRVRTRSRSPATCAPGRTSTSSPCRRTPERSVPVTMDPAPALWNTRLMGRKASVAPPREAFVGRSAATAAESSVRPRPSLTEQGMTGAPSRKVPLTAACTSSRTSSSISASARSALVSATTPRDTPRSSQTARCSSVWGITSSSAATTRTTQSMPAAPETIVWTNRSCPGTSMTLATTPFASGQRAKPSSMLMPRARSSGRRLVSVPVSALTSEVFPWST